MLTPYAFDILKAQFGRTVLCIHDDMDQVLYATSYGNVQTTLSKCTCRHFTCYGLPCAHIFDRRRTQNVSLFDSTLCNIRWSRDYYIAGLQSVELSTEQRHSAVLNTHRTKPIDSTVKYKNALRVAQQLANLCAEASNEVYEQRLDFLRSVVEQWNTSPTIGKCLMLLVNVTVIV